MKTTRPRCESCREIGLSRIPILMTFLLQMIQPLMFTLLLSVTKSINFNCWDESERHTLTYEGTNKTINILPTIRLFQGYYGSQWAMQYAAYMYLTEQLGVNVSWFPSDEHYIFYTNFTSTINLTDWYPDYYFHSIVADQADLLLEIWPGAMEVAS